MTTTTQSASVLQFPSKTTGDDTSAPHSVDSAAKEKMVEDLVSNNLALVGHVVRETMLRVPQTVDRNDLTSAGHLALLQAARAYDPDRGVPFQSFAKQRVRGAIVDELRQIDWASRAVRRRARGIDEQRSSLSHTLGRTPQDHEVAAALGITIDEVKRNDDDVDRAKVYSLDSVSAAWDGEDFLVSHQPTPEAAFESRELASYLAAAIDELPEKHRVVVTDFYVGDLAAVTANTLGVTESRISQLRTEAFAMMRDAINAALDPHLVPAHPRPGSVTDRRRTAYFEAVAARQMIRTGRRTDLLAG